jgi:hypothetical protein
MTSMSIWPRFVCACLKQILVLQLLLALLSDALLVRLELYRPHSANPQLVAVYPHRTAHTHAVLALLQMSDHSITLLLKQE